MTYQESLLLTDEKWSAINDEQKVEVLQTIENHVAFESGRLSCPVIGRFLYTGTDGVVLGSYDPENRAIFVNSSQFDADSKYGKTSENMIVACLHEGRHAYQHQVAQGTVVHGNAAEAESWKNNLAPGNYISFRDNPRAYYEQPVEADARSFAEQRYAQLVGEREGLREAPAHDASPAEVFARQFEAGQTASERADQMAACCKSDQDLKVENGCSLC